MARRDDLELRVGIDDRASKGLKELSDNVKKTANEVDKAGRGFGETAESITRFATGIAVGNLATLAARKVLRGFNRQLRDAVAASNEMQSAMIGLSSVAAAFGESQDEARMAAQDLASDGLMNVTEAADGLKNLLATGFNLEQSIDLMNAFRDSAAFNRQGMLDFGESIVGATQGLKNQNSIMVDNAGITKNLSVILKEAGFSQQDLGRITSDTSVRMALYNGILQEAAAFQGDAARVSETLQGAQQRLQQSVFNLRASFGNALAPALLLTTNAMIDQINTVNKALGPMEQFATSLVTFVTNARILAHTLKTILAPAFYAIRTAVLNTVTSFRAFFSAVSRAIHGDFGGALDVLKEAGTEIKENIDRGISDTVSNFKNFIPEYKRIAQEGADVIQKIQSQGLQGFSNLAREAIERTGDSMSEEAKKIAKKIAKEIRRYQRSVEALQRRFTENMRDAVVAHKERVEEIKEGIAEEKEAFQELIDEVKEEHEEELKQFRIAAKERLQSLQRQLDIEIERGKRANEDRIKNLEEMLRRERIALNDQLGDKEAFIEDEIEDEREKHKEKLDELQDELQKELDLQKKHADVFAQFRDAVAEDDISRLKRKFKEERELMRQEHEERLAEIKEQAIAERNARESAFPSTAGAETRTEGGKPYSVDELARVLVERGGYNPVDARNAALNKGGRADELAREFLGVRFARGGIITEPTNALIGESGPEAVVPLSRGRRAEASRVLEEAGIGGRNVTINMPVTMIERDVDIDALIERLAFRMKGEGLL